MAKKEPAYMLHPADDIAVRGSIKFGLDDILVKKGPQASAGIALS